jgi:hypothetical protein
MLVQIVGTVYDSCSYGLTHLCNKLSKNLSVCRTTIPSVAEAGMLSLVLLLLILATVTAGNYPVLDVSTSMRMLLLPVDTKVGSAIYRLRGTDSDFDFPLHFDIVGKEVILKRMQLGQRKNQHGRSPVLDLACVLYCVQGLGQTR